MKRLTVALFLLIAVGGGIVLLARPGAEASPATFTVDSTGDGGDSNTADGVCDDGSGNCTLRAAIQEANHVNNPGLDTINFSIPGAGPHTISPGSALPTISDPVIIDGTSEPDFAGSPIIELDGSGTGPAVHGLSITAGSSTVKGLVINRFQGDGISLFPNGGNTIEGNYIGTDVTGTADLGNSEGLLIFSPNNTIGGTAAGAGNVISGNDAGVRIYGSGTTGNVVLGNLIGTDVTGTADLGNSHYGVGLWEASGNTIGGTATGARNVISGNDIYGVLIISGATGNVVQGNYIGTDKNGTADLGNDEAGVRLQTGASSNTIGGTVAEARNVISGNDSNGVDIFHSDATGNQVQGNYIGTDKNGTADLGNTLSGVWIYDAPSNTIGGTAAEGNVMAYNGGDGVRVQGYVPTATSNTINGNSIHSNSDKGIENINGGNTELAPPVIDSVGSVSGHTDPKCYPCTVEVFSDNEDEGRIYHGSTTTNDDATGTWTYPGAVTGPNITATITDADGNTSEFSAPVSLYPPVGGLAELPDVSGSSAPNHVALAGAAAAALAALTAGVWYTRRRWLG